jgi:glyceraldehyde-3-phosphate dehydrogenase (NADP+)
MAQTLKSFVPKDGIYQFYSNGKWQESVSKQQISIVSPVDGNNVGNVQAMTQVEVQHAISSARDAFASWSLLPVDTRAQIIEKAADIVEENLDLLMHILSWEVGKVYHEAQDEVERTARMMRYYAQAGRQIQNDVLYSESFPEFASNKIAITKRVPLGVVLAITPFNYPFDESTPKLVGALIAGNTVVFKPSTQGAISGLYLTQCFHLAGIPAGVLNTVTGRSSELGDSLVGSELINAINFTGSTQTAQHIRDTMHIIPFIAGLSGKDAAIVLDDADLEISVPEIGEGAFMYSGQRCTAIKRVLVTDGISQEFIKKLCEFVNKSYKLGDPREKQTTQGPVINQHTVDFVNELLADALEKGATVLLGGQDQRAKDKLYYPATIVDNVTEDMRLAWEEPFGPILPIMHVKTKEDAIILANKSEYGLQSSVFTQNIDDAFFVAESLDVGNVQINGKDARGPDNFPFLGVKHSGLGQVQGAKYLIEAMTRIKTIVVNKHYGKAKG